MSLGPRYLVSKLARMFTILEMKVVSLLFFTVLTSAFLLFSILRDIRAGMVFRNKAWFWPELGDANDTEVGALIDASKDEASAVSASSKAQKVQLDTAR